MKKILALVLAIVFTFGFAACGEAAPEAPEAREVSVAFELLQIPSEAKEKGIFTGLYEDGTEAWTYETEELYVGMYDTVYAIGEYDGKYIFGCGESICALNIADGSLAWTNDEYLGQGAYWDFDEEGNLYLSASYGPVLMIIDSEGSTVYRYDDIYYEFSDGEKAVVSEYYAPFDLELSEGGLVKISLDSTQTTVEVDPACGVVKSEYIYTEPVDKDFLVGSWMLNGDNRLVLDIEEDMSFTMFIADESGISYYIYCGNLELSEFDKEHSQGLDYVRFVLDHEKTAAYINGEYTDPFFANFESAGDYVVKWCDSYEDDDFLCLSQVNNGDAVCGWYLNENYLPLHKVEIAG